MRSWLLTHRSPLLKTTTPRARALSFGDAASMRHLRVDVDIVCPMKVLPMVLCARALMS
jgi:hypothetical protein